MARRRYGRRRSYRRGGLKILTKVGGVSGLATGLYAADTLGVFRAAQRAMAGDFMGAKDELIDKATTPGAVITAVVPLTVVLLMKKFARGFGAKIPSWV